MSSYTFSPTSFTENATSNSNISWPLCKYKHIFGIPNQGIHQYRIFGLATMDIVQTIIGALLISWFFKIKFWICLLALFILGEILHILFCIDTAFIRWFK
jgi:hypothetical protein